MADLFEPAALFSFTAYTQLTFADEQRKHLDACEQISKRIG